MQANLLAKNIMKNISEKNINFLKLDITERRLNQRFDLIFFVQAIPHHPHLLKIKKHYLFLQLA